MVIHRDTINVVQLEYIYVCMSWEFRSASFLSADVIPAIYLVAPEIFSGTIFGLRQWGGFQK